MNQNSIERRVIYNKSIRPKSFIGKEVRYELRKTNIKGHSGSIYGFHLSYREPTDRWWQTFLCWKIYDTDDESYKNYVSSVIEKLVDKLNTVTI